MANIQITINTDTGSITRTAVQISEANKDRAVAYFNKIEPNAGSDAEAFTSWVRGIGAELKEDVLRSERDDAAAAAAGGVGDIEEI